MTRIVGCHLRCADGDFGQREPEFSPPLYKGAENLALVCSGPPPRETPLRPTSRKIESVFAVGVLHIHLEAKLLSEYLG